jgi:hypothetical protein
MKFIIDFHLYQDVKRLPITTGYRPDWTSSSKPEYNCAALKLPDEFELFPGESVMDATIIPLVQELWALVEVGDKIVAREGPKEIGIGTVIEVVS